MAQSLLDFGNIAQLAQNQLQNTISMAHLGMQQDRLAMQQSRADTYADQLKLQQDQLKQTTMMNLHKLWNDPGIAMVPGAREEIGARIGELAGAPSVNFNSIGVAKDTFNQYVKGLSSGDQKALHEGIDGLIATLPIDEAKKVIETIQNSGINAEKYQNMILARKDHEAKVEEIQNKNALITYAKPLYQGASFDGDRLLQGGDSQGLKKLRDAYEQAGPTAKGALLSSKNPLVPDKKEFAHMLDGKLGQASLKYDAVAKDYGDQVNQDLDLLKQHEHGIALPEGLNPSILQSRIEANSQLASYSRAMAAYTSDPLDKTKYAAAKEAAKTMNTNRLNIEALEKNTNAQRMQLQTTLANFRMDEAQRKNSQASALAEAQRQYYALPTNQQTTQAASKISQAVKDSTGFDVAVDDIFKNPNSPQSVVNVTNKVGEKAGTKLAENAMDIVKESHANAMGAVDILDGVGRIRSAMQKGNLTVGPGATIRNSIDQVAQMFGVTGKDREERLVNTRETIRALAQFSINARKLLRGQGQVTENEQKLLIKAESGDPSEFTIPELRTFINTTERLANKSIANHERNLEVAKQKPELQGYLDFYQVPKGQIQPSAQPSAAPSKGKAAPQSSGGAVLKSLPQGSRQIGTSGGKPVFEDAQGKRWI